MTQPHETLVVWQRADDLCVDIHTLTRDHFPRDERFGLTAQLRRAANSVPANIVEGYADSSPRWRVRYLRIAAGSLAEVGYAIHLAKRLRYVDAETFAVFDDRVRMVAAPLHGLIAHERIRRE